MHEAALAGTIAERWREANRAGLAGRPRLLVQGAHHEPTDFDAALRLHLAIVAPDLEGEMLEIVHVATPHLCSGCGRAFLAAAHGAACPRCGGAPLPEATAESVELDWPDDAGAIV
jgi:hypothetical protein